MPVPKYILSLFYNNGRNGMRSGNGEEMGNCPCIRDDFKPHANTLTIYEGTLEVILFSYYCCFLYGQIST